MTLPLEPYTVIDLTRARSGPTCVRQLAEMGAKVIKVESREQDDFTRDEFDFQNLHRNKRSMTLDLKHPRGVEVLKKLVARADVLVENFRPDVKHRLGIDYETLSKVNPRLVYASISGFGQSGPYRDRPGYDQIAQGLGGKEIPPQAGNDHPTGIPTGVFKTADGHMNIAASGQHMYRRLCEALDVKHLTDDPRFKTPQDRSKNRLACNAELEKATVTKSSAEWVEILNKAGVPCGPILNVKEVFEDEQIRHLKLATKIRHPRLGEQEVQNLPVTLSRTPGAVRTASPDLGEHTDQILGELGYSKEDIAALHRDGAV